MAIRDENGERLVFATNVNFTTFENPKEQKLKLIVATANPNVNVMVSAGSEVFPYAPYTPPTTYPLAKNLELRGIPKWDNSKGLYYDGDEYEPDGKVTRKYGIVDLGECDIDTYSINSRTMFKITGTGIKSSATNNDVQIIINTKYICESVNGMIYNANTDKTIGVNSSGGIYIRDDSYTDPAIFKTAMSGVYLVYKLATPTTESADSYRELQNCNGGGTEEFIDNRDVAIPVGTETFYPKSVWAAIDELAALIANS